jgi:hypothetical protein
MISSAIHQDVVFSSAFFSAEGSYFMRLIDRIGQRYDRLMVVARAPNANERDTNARWNCKCDCGRMVIAYGQDLARGKVKSCGCLNAERIFKHGKSRTLTYGVWKQLFQRCENPNSPSYKNYGGRGITVDPAWRDFATFVADMGDCPEGLSIERIDNNGPYRKGNCKWATPKAQRNNTRRNRRLTAFGREQTLMQWVEEFNVPWNRVRTRLRYGWTLERALTEPPLYERTKE